MRERSKTEALVDSAMMKAVSRVSGPLMIMLAIWILSNVSDTKSMVAGLSAQLGGVDTRVKNLEDWRNGFDVFAAESQPPIPPKKHH